MTAPILCGTDFSVSAAEAATAAAAVAAKAKAPLLLVHANEVLGPADAVGAGKPGAELVAGLQAKLDAEAARLRAMGATVEAQLVQGGASQVIVEAAAKRKAALVFVSSVGRRGPAKWLLGSVAEQVLRTAAAPVIVVRRGEPFVEWAKGARALRVLLGVEFSDASAAAARWVVALREFGTIDLVIGHVYWPPREQERLGRPRSLDLAGRDAEVERVLEKELAERFGPSVGKTGVRYRLQPGFGRAADHLIHLAVEERSDLIALGTHQRRGVDRLWYGSVSYGVAQLAPFSVACVPAAAAAGKAAAAGGGDAIPEIRSVVAATDFSESGNRVVAHACALVPKGGVVHLLHVAEAEGQPNPLYAHYSPGHAPTPEERAKRLAGIRSALEALVPTWARERGVEVRVEAIEAKNAVDAILEAADRHGASAVCVGSHGRTGVAKALLGSIAEACVKRSRRPVYLVRQ